MRKFGMFSVIAASAALTLSACGGGEEKAPAAEAPTPAPAAAPAVTPPAEAPAVTPAAGAPAAAGATVQLAGLTGDAAAGERIFAQCRTCHALEAGTNKVGPSLNGIFGRTAGTVPNFRYSAANKNSGIVWSEEIMFAYLENPREYIPGTYMSFVGLRQPQQRADVVAYLKANT